MQWTSNVETSAGDPGEAKPHPHLQIPDGGSGIHAAAFTRSASSAHGAQQNTFQFSLHIEASTSTRVNVGESD